jgi:hypothetical protein
MKMKKTSVLVASIALALAAGQASAGNPGKGPRASLAAATVCSLDGNTLIVDINLYDKTSGSGNPLVTAWSVEAWAKTERGNWDNQVIMFGGDADYDASMSVPKGGMATISADPIAFIPGDDWKAVNANSKITYMIEGDSNIEERTITNWCSDDPNTEEVEPAGIKL